MDSSLKQPAIRFFDIRSRTPMVDEWSYPQLLLLWGLSDLRIAEPL